MNRLESAYKAGQSIWYDHISASLLNSGRLAELTAQGIRGVTSNPSIFRDAIVGSSDYDERIADLARQKLGDQEILEALEVEDVTAACDVLLPVWEASGGTDGFVSLEVSPNLAYSADETVRQATDLWRRIGRPNGMIKVPATPAGCEAIQTLTAEGVNVNVTLIFSPRQYRAVAESFLRGLEARLKAEKSLAGVASVASVFVSRLDTAAAKPMADAGLESEPGQVGVDNARLVYQDFIRIFSGARWNRLAQSGASVQRPLWASTSVKRCDWPDCLYVDSLIGPHTVNTVPPKTLDAFLDHGAVRDSVTSDVPLARSRMAQLAACGIDVERLAEDLLAKGVEQFVTAADQLLLGVKQKRAALGF